MFAIVGFVSRSARPQCTRVWPTTSSSRYATGILGAMQLDSICRQWASDDLQRHASNVNVTGGLYWLGPRSPEM